MGYGGRRRGRWDRGWYREGVAGLRGVLYIGLGGNGGGVAEMIGQPTQFDFAVHQVSEAHDKHSSS
jgi:hypothetical protein